MTDPVEALAAETGISRAEADEYISTLRASGFDVVPTGDGYVCPHCGGGLTKAKWPKWMNDPYPADVVPTVEPAGSAGTCVLGRFSLMPHSHRCSPDEDVAAIRAESTGTLDVASIADRVRAMTPHTGDDYRRGYDRAITLMVAVARLSSSDTGERG